eukprot:COSAG04_NODE_7343_length_1144_cov_1.081340_1_plen_107_part_10
MYCALLTGQARLSELSDPLRMLAQISTPTAPLLTTRRTNDCTAALSSRSAVPTFAVSGRAQSDLLTLNRQKSPAMHHAFSPGRPRLKCANGRLMPHGRNLGGPAGHR